MLLLTGLAAYRSDQLRAALDYGKQSLDLAPNDTLARVYERVRREADADHSAEKLLGMHIALRYEGEALPSDTARAILSALDEDYSRIAGQLGCSSDERIVAIVQSRDAYLRGTGAAEWSGGEYDGRIHIAWTEGKQSGPQMRRPSAPSWSMRASPTHPAGHLRRLVAGLAQKLSGDQLSPASRDQLRQLAAARQMPRLEDLHQDWSHLSIENARLAYNLALAAADAVGVLGASVTSLDISPNGQMLALDFWGPAGRAPNRKQHDIAIVNISDRVELRRWSLPEAVSYGGVFAGSGLAFCTEPRLESVRSKHEWVCREIATGSETLRRDLPLGVGGVRAVANRLIVGHSRITLLPFPLFGTDHIVTRTDQEMWDFQSGREIASWRIDRQKVLPKADAASESAVSADGNLVAVGGSGILRVYRISP